MGKLEDSKNLNLYKNYVTEAKRRTRQRNFRTRNPQPFQRIEKQEPNPRHGTYNSLMTVLLGAHKFEQAHEIFQEMLVDSHEPNVQTILNLLKIHKCTVYKKNDATNKNDRLNKLDEVFNNFAAKRLPEDLTVKGLNELLEALMNCNKS